MHSTPGIDSPVIGIQTAGIKYIFTCIWHDTTTDCFWMGLHSTSPGSVTDTDTEYRGISKYRYRYRSRYSKYRKIPNTEEKIPKKIGKSVFQFCKYNPLVIRVYASSGGQLSQIESFPRSVYIQGHREFPFRK